MRVDSAQPQDMLQPQPGVQGRNTFVSQRVYWAGMRWLSVSIAASSAVCFCASVRSGEQPAGQHQSLIVGSHPMGWQCTGLLGLWVGRC